MPEMYNDILAMRNVAQDKNPNGIWRKCVGDGMYYVLTIVT